MVSALRQEHAGCFNKRGKNGKIWEGIHEYNQFHVLLYVIVLVKAITGKFKKNERAKGIKGFAPAGLFRLPQFPLYLSKAEVVRHETSQCSSFFSHQNHI